jgi:hypothetical protein
VKPLAVIHSYRELHAALRQRITDLNISLSVLDDTAGLQDGYAAKLLGPNPQGTMYFQGHTIDLALGVLGVSLRLVEDPESLARVRRRLTKRDPAQVRRRDAEPLRSADQQIKKAQYFVEQGRKGGVACFAAMSTAQKSRLGKAGARARWRRTRAG